MSTTVWKKTEKPTRPVEQAAWALVLRGPGEGFLEELAGHSNSRGQALSTSGPSILLIRLIFIKTPQASRESWIQVLNHSAIVLGTTSAQYFSSQVKERTWQKWAKTQVP